MKFANYFVAVGLTNVLAKAILATHLDWWSRNNGDFLQYCGRNTVTRGRLTQKRIVGGQVSAFGEWPWLISQRTRNEATEFHHLCGGTLIHPKWILTAKHCVMLSDGLSEHWSGNLEDMEFRIGEHDMEDDLENHQVRRPLRFVFPADNGLNNDIALVELDKEATLSEHNNVACLPSVNDVVQPGESLVVVGWGHLYYGAKEISSILRHVSITVIPDADCYYAYWPLVVIDDSMMCARHETGGRDACQFDSGGPLGSLKDGAWVVEGIVSRGINCGLVRYPGIYTRVAPFVSWIESVINSK